MGQYTSYWLYQKYETRGSQEPIPCYPNTYSVDGDGTMQKIVKIENDVACGYSPEPEVQYRWVNLPESQYVCDECPASITVWEKTDNTICLEVDAQYRWIKSDDTICIEEDPEVQYRWVNMDAFVEYYCEGTTKYYKQKRQVSYDDGQTWQDVSPAEYQKGGVAESQSTDCGYVPPPPKPEYDKQPFTVIPREDARVGIEVSLGSMNTYYSIDSGVTWVSGSFVSVSAGEKVMFRGAFNVDKNRRMYLSVMYEDYSGRATFDIEGNPTSLLYNGGFGNPKPNSFGSFFWYNSYNVSKVISAKNLYLPSASVDYCYDSMFYGCETLTEAPVIRGTIAYYACYHMFYGCKSLTSAKITGGIIK